VAPEQKQLPTPALQRLAINLAAFFGRYAAASLARFIMFDPWLLSRCILKSRPKLRLSKVVILPSLLNGFVLDVHLHFISYICPHRLDKKRLFQLSPHFTSLPALRPKGRIHVCRLYISFTASTNRHTSLLIEVEVPDSYNFATSFQPRIVEHPKTGVWFA